MLNSRCHSVAFIGPIPSGGTSPRGGYQACNERTINALRSMNVIVDSLPYPVPSGSMLGKGIAYVFGFIRLAVRLLRARVETVHITGLYKHFIYPELLLVIIGRIKGKNVIYDIRAGSAKRHYANKSFIYKYAFRFTLKAATCVMVEGAEYIAFVRDLVGKTPYLLPNHVSLADSESVPRPELDDAACEVALVYVGRLVANKGIEIVLQSAALLRKRGIDVRLRIAGEGELSYVNSLKSRYADPDNEWLGAVSPQAVLRLFAASHFFLFPTTHLGEGHSNALTESMAAGCVPLVSMNGFNQSVIGDCGRVLPQNSDATVYAETVIEIIHSNQWLRLSVLAARRARECYETVQVVTSLIEQYKHWGGQNATDGRR